MKRTKSVYRCDSCESILPRQRKYCDERCKQIELCKSMGTANYRNRHVSTEFQLMVRAEAAAHPQRFVPAFFSGAIGMVCRDIGECACITCGRVLPWKGTGAMHCGHFCSRKDQSVLFDPLNVECQCAGCNHPPGKPAEFRIWMLACRGIEVIERLENLKRQSVSFSRESLVDMRIEYSKRLKAAVERMREA